MMLESSHQYSSYDGGVFCLLLSACKYKDIIPEGNSIETVLVQSELQNKVKTLLDLPLPVARDFQCSDISVTFEKGKVPGVRVKSEDHADPTKHQNHINSFYYYVYCSIHQKQTAHM